MSALAQADRVSPETADLRIGRGARYAPVLMIEGPEDDWFSGSDLGVPLARSPVEDDWLEEDLSPGSRRSFDLSSVANRRVLVPVAVVVVLLVSLLAAVGVFSSGSPRAKPPITSTTTTTTPVTPTTTPVVHPSVGVPATALKPGATGPQVTVLQRALKSLGYSTGVLDGNYGPATTAAVSAFQRASGLTADGIFGPKTLQGLTRAVAARGH